MLNIVSPNPQRRTSSSIEAEIPSSWGGSHPTNVQQLSRTRPERRFETPLRLMTLNDIGQSIHHSDSWMYGNHIVPIYDVDGNQVNAKEEPPFPWEQLPPPRIKVGKKLWHPADIAAWLDRFEARTSDEDALVEATSSRRVAQ